MSAIVGILITFKIVWQVILLLAAARIVYEMVYRLGEHIVYLVWIRPRWRRYCTRRWNRCRRNILRENGIRLIRVRRLRAGGHRR